MTKFEIPYTLQDLSKIYLVGKGGHGFEANLAYCLRNAIIHIEKLEDKIYWTEEKLVRYRRALAKFEDTTPLRETYKEALLEITKIQFEKDNIKPLAKAIFIAQAALDV